MGTSITSQKRFGFAVTEPQKFNQSFTVAWNHQLWCTRNAFRIGGEVTQVLQKLNPPTLLILIDSGIDVTNQTYVQTVKKWISDSQIQDVHLRIVQGSESAKTGTGVLDQVLGEINTLGMCRKSAVLAIGGGAMLDAVGFATSIAHRGLQLVRMPSTTLSACDSGVGVKNGLNKFGKKNFIGVFDPPFAVINDYELLRSLEYRHWISGLSEVVKVSLVKHRELYVDLKQSVPEILERNLDVMASFMTDSATLHLEHIANGGDPFERNEARPLDFGHWAAHKLEQMTNHELTHGEAVSIGLSIDLQCSVELGLLNQDVALDAFELLRSLGLPTTHPCIFDSELLDGIEEFREHLGGELTILLLEDIAKPTEVHELPESIVQQAIQKLQ
ncbi:MAG: 3-dehydroquinate synthase [Phycisphaerales bacterium]|jgi:3-dehydroquinate synthase|nr:3-dehydroquinate synthase [Phycisphaerales bacterium]